MTFDQAQSPRLGQKTPVESTYVRMFAGTDIPEAAWPGQIIFRTDTQTLQVYSELGGWLDVVGGTLGILTYVGPTVPTAHMVGDLWFDTSNSYRLYIARSATASTIATGQWELAQDAAAAQATANTAQSTATTANNNATTAQSTATTANNNATTAQSTANTAQTTATNAQSTANTAQTTATNAQTSANTAQTTANNAQTAATAAQNTANSKAKTYRQATAPSSGMNTGDVWINTADNNRVNWWNGAAWVHSDGSVPGQTVGLTTQGGVKSVVLNWTASTNADSVYYSVYSGTSSTFTADANHLIGSTTNTRFTATTAYDDMAGVTTTVLNPVVTYYYQVIATDPDGSGAASAVASGSPVQVNSLDIATNAITANQIAANAIKASSLDTVLAIVSQLQIGSYMTLDGDNGLMVDPPAGSGGKTQIFTDGKPGSFAGGITATNATITNYLDLQGTNNKISGELDLSTGVSNPYIAPTVSFTMTDPSVMISTDVGKNQGFQTGLYQSTTDSTKFWACDALFSGSGTIYTINKTNGACYEDWHVVPNNFNHSAVVQTSDNGWVIWGSDGNRSNGWYIYRYNSSWVKTGESFVMSNPTPLGTVALGYDGTSIFVAVLVTSSGTTQLRVYKFPLSSGGGFTYTGYSYASWGADNNIRMCYVGSADFGSSKLVVGTRSGAMYGYAIPTFATSAITRDTTVDWSRANNDLMYGCAWDGARFWMLGESNKLYKYSLQTDTTARTFGYSYYDSNATGGTHETMLSPTVIKTPTKRYWSRISGNAPPNSGGTDDPDRDRFYVDNHRQAEVPTGQYSILLDSIDLTGAASQSSNGFAVGALGSLKSVGGDASPYISLVGDGSYRLGDLSGTSAGVSNTSIWVDMNYSTTTNNFSTGAEALRMPSAGFSARNGQKYRVWFQCTPSSNTAGDYTHFSLRYDTVNTGITGTLFQDGYIDHRIVGRLVTLSAFGEFVWTGTDKTTVYVKLTFSSGGGTITDNANANRPTRIIVAKVAI